MAKHNEIGAIGEETVANFLIRKGFHIVCRNYRKKWGEIDIVALKDNEVHFIEVKTVSRRAIDGSFPKEINDYRPEDNMHPRKLKRLQRAIQSYLLEKYKKDPDWQFDLACLYLDPVNRIAKVNFIENMIL